MQADRQVLGGRYAQVNQLQLFGSQRELSSSKRFLQAVGLSPIRTCLVTTSLLSRPDPLLIISPAFIRNPSCTPRAAGVRAYFVLPSPRFITSAIAKPQSHMARMWV